MRSEQQTTEFDIEEARRVLGEVFAPWVQDLNLSIAGLRLRAAGGRRRRLAAGRDPAHAVFRTAVPHWRHRLRPGADGVCGHRDGDRQPRRQPRLSPDDDGRSDHAFHARGDDNRTCWRRRGWSGSGRTMSFGRVTLSSASDNKPVAMVSSAFAML